MGAEESTSQSSAVLTGNETVLLVEGEDSLRSLTGSLLKMCGYNVLDAKDGMEATRLAWRFNGPIHPLLTDPVMPKVGGRELAEPLTPSRPEMKVLYISGYTGQSFTGRSKLDDGTHFLQKPFSRDVLVRKIREVVGAKTAVGP